MWHSSGPKLQGLLISQVSDPALHLTLVYYKYEKGQQPFKEFKLHQNQMSY
jgi:hypothetical protein